MADPTKSVKIPKPTLNFGTSFAVVVDVTHNSKKVASQIQRSKPLSIIQNMPKTSSIKYLILLLQKYECFAITI